MQLMRKPSTTWSHPRRRTESKYYAEQQHGTPRRADEGLLAPTFHAESFSCELKAVPRSIEIKTLYPPTMEEARTRNHTTLSNSGRKTRVRARAAAPARRTPYVGS